MTKKVWAMTTREWRKYLKQGLAIVGVSAALLSLASGSAVARAAGTPALSGSYLVKATSSVGLPVTGVAPMQAVWISPKVPGCRFDAVFISAARPDAAAMRDAVATAKANVTRIGITYTKAADGVCLLDAVGAASTTTGTAPQGEGDSGQTQWEGYHNKYATTFKSAFRDFGQGKFDESVDPISGVLVLTHTDVVIPGPAGLDIKITRRYQSPAPKTIGVSIMSSLNPQFTGLGWDVIGVVGGLQGKADCNSNYFAGVGSGYNPMRYHQLPVWTGSDGSSEVFLFEATSSGGLIGWVTASGVRIDCDMSKPGNVSNYATTPDGLKITIGYPTDPLYGLPKRIEDRFGNWIDIAYVEDYQVLLLMEGTLGLVKTGRLPIRQITSSDGRTVDFVYKSGDPSWPVGRPPSIENFYLSKIQYGEYEVSYEYDRQDVTVTSPLGTAVVPKFFLNKVSYPDRSVYRYSYNLNFFNAANQQDICTPQPGDGLISSITHPHGGVSNYTWIQSKRGDAPYACGVAFLGGVWSPLHNMIRSKENVAGGQWKYSYSDMPLNVISHPADDFVGTFLGTSSGPQLVEWGKVVGPDATVVHQHNDRYGVRLLTNEQGTYYQMIAPNLLGKLLQRDTFAAGTVANPPGSVATPLQSEEFDYVSVGAASAPGLFMADPDLMAGDQVANAPWGSGWPSMTASKLKSHKIWRSRSTYANVTTTGYSDECYAANATTEAGDRTKKTTKVFGSRATQYCQALNEKLYDGTTVLVGETVRTLRPDNKAVQTETRFGSAGSALAASGLVTSYTYDDVTGDLATTTDARNFKTSFNDYYRGTPREELHPVASSDASAESTTTRIRLAREVDSLGRITSETDGEGRTTRFEYNGMHKPTLITLPKLASARDIQFTYFATPTTDTITRGGRTETVTYDGFGRVTNYDNAGIATKYGYDGAGRLTFVSFPGSDFGQTAQLDALGRPTTLTEPNPSTPGATVDTTIVYNDTARTVTVTRPGKTASVATMEAFGDPSKAWVRTKTLPDVGSMETQRNVLGQVTSVSEITPSGTVTREMRYDANKGYFLVEESHPELGGKVYYERDNNGNATERRVGSPIAAKTDYAYDGQNRLVTTTPPTQNDVNDVNGPTVQAPTVTNVWYKTGQLKSVTAGGVTRAYEFDANNNLTKETVSIDGTPRELNYEYDSLDALSKLTYPSGKSVEFAPDLLGRPKQVASSNLNIVTSATYWPSGLPKKISYANDVTQDFAEQSSRPLVGGFAVNKVSSPARPTSGSLIGLSYTYDTVGNLLIIDDALGMGYGRIATYDQFDRIKTNGAETFTYRGVGDFDTKSGASFAYGSSTRLLSSISGAVNRSYAYDTFGNAKSDGRGFAYGYDRLGNLRTVTGNGLNTSYIYDGHGHLAKKTAADGSTTVYLYGKNGRLYAEFGPIAGSSKEYFYLGNKLVGQIAKQ